MYFVLRNKAAVQIASDVRSGKREMPDISKLSYEDASFVLKLIKDDDFYEFWSDAQNYTAEHLQALVEFNLADTAYKRAEVAFRSAERRRNAALKHLRSVAPKEEGVVQAQNKQ